MKKNTLYAVQKSVALGIAALSVTIILALCSFAVINKAADETWKQLGITQQEGADKIKNSLLNDYFDYAGVKDIKNLATGNKVAIAKDMLAYAKQFLSSKEFQSEYQKLRDQAKPGEFVASGKTKESIRKEQVEETKELIAQTEKALKEANPDMKKMLQPILDMHNNNLKDYQDPNSKMIETFYQQELFTQQQSKKDYEESRKNWEANYPADYKQLIRTRLQRYISIASSVDFAAQLRNDGSRKRFVNSVYEGKNAEWKMVFRAGKDINDVAVSFCQQWLKELQ